MQSLQQSSIAEVLAEVKIIDTHEHLTPEKLRLGLKLDFTYFLPHYLSSDLVSAGMTANDLEAIRTPARVMSEALDSRINPYDAFYPFPERLPQNELSLEEKWERFALFWKKTRNTGYARCILIALRDLFGIDDLNEETCLELSEKLQDSNRAGWYHYVLRERSRIEISLLDHGLTDIDRDLFVPVLRFDHFVDIQNVVDLQRLGYEANMDIYSLDDLVNALEVEIARRLEQGMIAIKSGMAPQRTLYYGEATRHEAEQVFNRLFRHPHERLSWEEGKPLQDYMLHQIIRQALEHNLIIQVHTGLQEGNGNIVINSNPTLLANLFLQYPNVRFDIFHASYPYHSELAALAKNFPNVYADLCWMHIISPWKAAHILHEFLDTIPVSKILGFGGDFVVVEGTYGHSRIARQVISQVLAERVEAGYYTEEEALTFGRMILRDNAKELFGL